MQNVIGIVSNSKLTVNGHSAACQGCTTWKRSSDFLCSRLRKYRLEIEEKDEAIERLSTANNEKDVKIAELRDKYREKKKLVEELAEFNASLVIETSRLSIANEKLRYKKKEKEEATDVRDEQIESDDGERSDSYDSDAYEGGFGKFVNLVFDEEENPDISDIRFMKTIQADYTRVRLPVNFGNVYDVIDDMGLSYQYDLTSEAASVFQIERKYGYLQCIDRLGTTQEFYGINGFILLGDGIINGVVKEMIYKNRDRLQNIKTSRLNGSSLPIRGLINFIDELSSIGTHVMVSAGSYEIFYDEKIELEYWWKKLMLAFNRKNVKVVYVVPPLIHYECIDVRRNLENYLTYGAEWDFNGQYHYMVELRDVIARCPPKGIMSHQYYLHEEQLFEAATIMLRTTFEQCQHEQWVMGVARTMMPENQRPTREEDTEPMTDELDLQRYEDMNAV